MRFAGGNGFLRKGDKRLKEIWLVGRLLQCRANLQAPNCRETKPRQRWSNSIKEWLRVCAVEYTTPREKEMALTTRVSGSNGNDVFHRGVSPNENEMSDGWRSGASRRAEGGIS